MSEPQTLPAGWMQTTLGEVADLERGITFPASAKSSTKEFGSIPCLRTTNIQDTVEWEDMLFIPRTYMKGNTRKFIQSMDILMSVANSRELVGKVALVINIPHEEATLGGFISAIRAIQPDSAKYLYHFLRYKDTKESLKKHASQTVNIANLSMENIASLSISLPPLAEQRRIVAAIEQQFTRLDEGIASLRQAQTRLKRYRAAVLKAAVAGDLTTAWRAAHPDAEPAATLLARILAERRARWEDEQRAKGKDLAKVRYDEPIGPDTAGLPALPEGWVWATVEQLASDEKNAITDGPFGSNLKTEHYTDKGARVIRLQNIGNGVFNDAIAYIAPEHFQKLDKHQVFSGDIVIAALGEKPPRSCIIPSFVGPAIVKADCIRFNVSKHIINTFINFALNSEPVQKLTSSLVHGIGRPRLNLGEIKAILLPLPPLTEQEQIVAEVERRLSVVSEVEAEVAANLKRAERLRQSILREAFAGRLVAQDPADEPASVLLARIQAERNLKNRHTSRIRKSTIGSISGIPEARTEPDLNDNDQVKPISSSVKQLMLLDD